MTSQLIRQVRVLDPTTAVDRVADVRVVDGWIEAIEPSLPGTAETVIDGDGKVLLPGLVDLHSHSGEPGFETRETLEQLLHSAQAGGFTRVGLLPSTQPPADTPAGIAELRRCYGRCTPRPDAPLPQLYLWGALTQTGEQMSELAALAAAEIIGFADAQPLGHPLLVRRLLEYVRPLEKPVMLWGCDRNLSQGGLAREGRYAFRYGLPGDPVSVEASALAALLEQVAIIGTPVHLMQISTARSVELIAAAKAQGLPVSASTTWMHLLLNTRSLQSYDTSLRLDPPLGNPEDQAALMAAVKSGTLDAVAINHRAYTYEEKTVGFASAPPGAIGLELALSLLWPEFSSDSTSLLSLVRALSSGPAQVCRQAPPTLQPGHRAEMILFDPAQLWRVDKEQLHTPAQNTPWWGLELSGRVLHTWSAPA